MPEPSARRKIRIEQEKRLRELWEAAGTSIGCQVHESARWEARSLVSKLQSVREMVRENEQRMATIARNFPGYDCLLSISGFGPTVSTMVLAAIGNPARFEHSGQVVRLAELDLSAERSGKNSDSAKPVISKQGKAALRYAMVQAAIVASAKNPDIRELLQQTAQGRELGRGINLKKKVKLAAKLLIVAWTLMKTERKVQAFLFQGVTATKQAAGEKSPINNVEAMTSGGTIPGLSLNLEAWIRND